MNENTSNQQPNTNYQLLPGLTLIELITGLSIFAVVSLMIASVYIAHFKLFSTQSATIDAQAQNTIAIDEMANQIREADTAVSSCIAFKCRASCIDFGQPRPPTPIEDCLNNLIQASNSYLIIRLWPLDDNGNPKEPLAQNPDHDYVHYYLEPAPGGTQNLFKDIGVYDNAPEPSTRTDSHKILASNVDSINFQYLDSDDIDTPPYLATQVVITLNSNYETIFDQTQKEPITTTRKVFLRNKQ